MQQTSWSRGHTIVLALVVVALISIGFAFPNAAWKFVVPELSLRTRFAIVIIFISIFMAVVGHGINGRVDGVFIDSRNRISLSRFQMILWTGLVLSAIWAAMSWNVRNATDHGLGDLKIPSELFEVLGLAAFTGLASPILLSQKRNRDPDLDQFATELATLQKSGTNTGGYGNDGMVVTRNSPAEANWSDLFRGDETGNLASPDVGKLQNFLFTILLVSGYCGALLAKFSAIEPGTAAPDFPGFSDTMVVFLGISHAAYLSTKVVSNTQSAPSS
jgi:hypothetical protein